MECILTATMEQPFANWCLKVSTNDTTPWQFTDNTNYLFIINLSRSFSTDMHNSLYVPTASPGSLFMVWTISAPLLYITQLGSIWESPSGSSTTVWYVLTNREILIPRQKQQGNIKMHISEVRWKSTDWTQCGQDRQVAKSHERSNESFCYIKHREFEQHSIYRFVNKEIASTVRVAYGYIITQADWYQK